MVLVGQLVEALTSKGWLWGVVADKTEAIKVTPLRNTVLNSTNTTDKDVSQLRIWRGVGADRIEGMKILQVKWGQLHMRPISDVKYGCNNDDGEKKHERAHKMLKFPGLRRVS